MTFERTLWIVRKKWADDPALRFLVLALASVWVACWFGMCAVGCAAPNRQVQAQIADQIARAANVAEPAIVEEYRRTLFKCLDGAQLRTEYNLCRAKADHDWTRVRLAWGHLRMAQDDYAKALETGGIDITAYLDGLRIAYCEFKAYIPSGYKLPEIPTLVCPEAP